jgi:hypothetical protein
MASALSTVTNITSKIVPTSKGIVQNFVTGVGADTTMRLLDNIVGSPVQRIFSFNLPIIGSIGPIDLLNYVAHAGGFKVSRKGLIAVGAAKIASGALSNIGPIMLPQSNIVMAQSTPTPPSPVGSSGGLPI